MWNCKSFYQVVCFIQLSETGMLSVVLKMDKIEYRAVIKFFVKEGLTPNQTRRNNSWEKTRFANEKNHLSSGQCTRPQKCFGNRKIKGSALWTVGTSTLLLRFGSLWLLSLPKTQTLPRWSAFFFESRGDFSCRGVFCRSYEEPLQGRDNGPGVLLE